MAAIAFSAGGTLYGVTEKTVGGFDQQLITINPATGAMASDLGSLIGNLNVQDMTFAPDGNIYATNFSSALIEIDLQTLSNTLIGIGNIGDLEGIAAVPTSVPEPGTLSLIGIASLGLLVRLRNKTSKP